MDCVNVREHLPFFGDGSLDPATEQEMDRHIAHCPGCAEAYEAQKRVLNMISMAYDGFSPSPDIDLTASIRKGIASRKHERGLFKYLTPVAAAAVVIISVFLHGFYVDPVGQLPDMAEVDDETYYAYIGEYFISSYDFLALANDLPMDDYDDSCDYCDTYIGEHFIPSNDFLALANDLPMDDYDDLGVEMLAQSGYVDISPDDLFSNLDEDAIVALLQQALY